MDLLRERLEEQVGELREIIKDLRPVSAREDVLAADLRLVADGILSLTSQIPPFVQSHVDLKLTDEQAARLEQPTGEEILGTRDSKLKLIHERATRHNRASSAPDTLLWDLEYITKLSEVQTTDGPVKANRKPVHEREFLGAGS